jgi:hypothetical protein
MLHSSWRTLAGVLPIVLLLATCKPKPGDQCSGAGLPICSGPNSAWVCANGVVTALPCHGAKACTSSGSTLECDNSLATVGDVCDEPNDAACALDHKSMLECQTGKFVLVETCKGARGCVVDGDKISCDNDVADLGDPCQMEADYACTSDKLLALKCVAHKFEALNACRGKDGCRVLELPEEKKTDFICDDSLAQENDACDTQGEEACNMDKSAIYVCRAGHFLRDRACTGGCTFDDKGEKFQCADAVGTPKVAAPKTASAKAAPKPTMPAAKARH